MLCDSDALAVNIKLLTQNISMEVLASDALVHRIPWGIPIGYWLSYGFCAFA